MTDEQLQGFAAQALNMAKKDIERHRFHFLIATYHEADQEGLHRMTRIEKLIIEKLGEAWLNSGRTKDAGFELLRVAVDLMPPDAVIFVTSCNAFTPTAKFAALSREQQEELMNSGHDRHHEAVKEGLLVIQDGLLALAQTTERICVYQQAVENGAFSGSPQTKVFPQEGFSGRMKMFGKESR